MLMVSVIMLTACSAATVMAVQVRPPVKTELVGPVAPPIAPPGLTGTLPPVAPPITPPGLGLRLQ